MESLATYAECGGTLDDDRLCRTERDRNYRGNTLRYYKKSIGDYNHSQKFFFFILPLPRLRHRSDIAGYPSEDRSVDLSRNRG